MTTPERWIHPFVHVGQRLARRFPWIFDEIPGLTPTDLEEGGHAVVGPVALHLFNVITGRLASARPLDDWRKVVQFMEAELASADENVANEIGTGFVENLLPESPGDDDRVISWLPPNLKRAYCAMRDWRPGSTETSATV